MTGDKDAIVLVTLGSICTSDLLSLENAWPILLLSVM